MRTLNDTGVTTRRPLELVNWTNEEGVRFEPAMLASGAVAGRFTPEYVYGRTDRDGATFGDELERIGYKGERGNRPGPIAAYLELHVEQGPVLEDAAVPVGVVEGIVGITWSEIIADGRADHAGPSPMPLRRDALVAAARMIAGVDDIARAVDGAVGTVGRIAAEPNVINTIPGKVTMSVDLRHPDAATLDRLVAGLERLASDVAAQTGVTVGVNRFWTSEPTPFAPEVVDAVQAAAEEMGIATRRCWSGAGHDAKYIQEIAPSAMIFARSINGLSHCEQEYSTPEDLKLAPTCCCARRCAWPVSRASAPVTSEGHDREQLPAVFGWSSRNDHVSRVAGAHAHCERCVRGSRAVTTRSSATPAPALAPTPLLVRWERGKGRYGVADDRVVTARLREHIVHSEREPRQRNVRSLPALHPKTAGSCSRS